MPPAKQSVWDDPAYVQRWNDMYGFDMRGAPIRTRFIFPFLREQFGDLQGQNLLDLGCGNGNLIHNFSKAAFESWTGVDAGAAVLDSAKGANPDPRLTFIRADATRPIDAILPATMDQVTSVFVMEEIPERKLIGYLCNIGSALKQDGRAHIFTQHPAHLLMEAAKAAENGVPNGKYIGSRGYYDRRPSEYAFASFTTEDGTPERIPYHHHTLADIVNAASGAGLAITSMLEIPATALAEGADYMKARASDTPRFLYLEMRCR
jgi:SAM-dependent methyltransferase